MKKNVGLGGSVSTKNELVVVCKGKFTQMNDGPPFLLMNRVQTVGMGELIN